MMFPPVNTLITHAVTFHREHCQCENCELVHVSDYLEAPSVQQEMSVTEQNGSCSQTTSATFEAKEKVRKDLEQYRMKLQRYWQKLCGQHWPV